MMMMNHQQQKQQNRHRRRRQNFAHAKDQCLGKRDKSSAGRIDAHAVEICNLINELEPFYTTSSCSGRCFLYAGLGIKSTDTFQRFRVNHDRIKDAERYFDLSTLHSDPTGGGDEIFRKGDEMQKGESSVIASSDDINKRSTNDNNNYDTKHNDRGGDVWLRFEPFILHVACRSMAAASALMTAARPSFKNVGLTSWKETIESSSSSSNQRQQQQQCAAKFIVAIWGDEGLDMPLCLPNGSPLQAAASSSPESSSSPSALIQWLAQLVNERHERNWAKIARFVQAIRDMELPVEDDHDDENNLDWGYASRMEGGGGAPMMMTPRSFDVIGDVALLHSVPPTSTNGTNEETDDDEDDKEQRLQDMGRAILKKNKGIKVVVLRQSNLVGPERVPGHDGNLKLLAGGPEARMTPSLVTTHSEYGISCVVNVHDTFFSPRMCQERQRIVSQVKDGEDVLVLFAGVGMEALLIAGRTKARSIVAMEWNEAAILCAQRSQRMLERNKTVLVPGAADHLEFIQGDVLGLLPKIPKKSYDRILAPRPKLGAKDGDLGGNANDGGDNEESSWTSAATFLKALLPVLKDGGVCHWYDFVADHEFPACTRSRTMLQETCAKVMDDDNGDNEPRCLEILHVANAGSVAMRQLRVCIDFRVVPRADKNEDDS